MRELEEPVFIVSAPRSGASLVRFMLDTHPAIAVAPPADIFGQVYPYLYSYGELARANNLLALAEDMLQLPAMRQWRVRITARALIVASAEPSFAGLYGELHRIDMRAQVKGRWGASSVCNALWMDEIKTLFPRARFIHVVRDGRDAALDLARELPIPPYAAALRWERAVKTILDSASRLSPRDFLQIRYESLRAAPPEAARAICAFLGLAFDPRMLANRQTRSPRTDRSRVGTCDAFALEGAIGETLTALGYPLLGAAGRLDARLGAQLVESDTLAHPEDVRYRLWHAERRQSRRRAGVWQQTHRLAPALWACD